MSTYIQGVTDNPVAIPLFQPDLNMVQRTLATKQAKFDAGFNSFQNAYSKVMNAPVTNLGVMQWRDDFSKKISSQIKETGKIDFSVAENVTKASEILAPAWENKKLLTDMMLTKQNENEINRMNSYRLSTDPKMREQYSDVAYEHIQNYIGDLRDADYESDDIFRVKAAKFVPVADVAKELSEARKQFDYHTTFSTTENGRIITTKNGEKSFQNFYAFAKNLMGDKYRGQFEMFAEVDFRRAHRSANNRRQMEGMAPIGKQEFAIDFVQDRIETIRESARNHLNVYQEKFDLNQKEIESVLESVKDKAYSQEELLNSPEGKKLARLAAEQQNLEKGLIPQAQKELEAIPFVDSKEYEKQIAQLASNPVGYVASTIANQTARNWAKVESARAETKIEIDPVWVESVKNNQWLQEMRLKREEQDRKNKVTEMQIKGGMFVNDDLLNEEGTGGNGGGSGRSSGSAAGGAGKETEAQRKLRVLNTPEFNGASAEFVDRSSPFDEFVAKSEANAKRADEMIFDYRYAGRIFKQLPNMTEGKAVEMSALFQRYLANPTALSPEERKKVGTFVADVDRYGNGVDRSIAYTKAYTPTEARQTIYNWIQKRYIDRVDDPAAFATKDDMEIAQYYSQAKSLQETNNRDSEQFRKAERNVVGRKAPLLQGKDGGIITAAELATNFGTLVYQNNRGQIVTKTSEELAQMYLNGEIDLSADPLKPMGLAADSKTNWYMPNLRLQKGSPIEADLKKIGSFEQLIKFAGANKVGDDIVNPKVRDFGSHVSALNDRFGVNSSKNISDKITQLKNEIVTTAVGLKDGIQGIKTSYYLDNTEHGEQGEKLLNDIANPANRTAVYVDGKRVDDEDVHQFVNNQTNRADGSVSVITRGNTQFVQFRVTDIKKDDLPDVLKYGNKTITVELKKDAVGDGVKNLQTNDGIYLYGKLLRGESIKSDPILEGSGFRYSVTPGGSANAPYAHLSVERKVKNQDGEWVWKSIELPNNGIVDFTGPNRKNPDEIMGLINNQFIPMHRQQHLQTLTAEAEQSKKEVADAQGNPVKKLGAKEWYDEMVKQMNAAN
jgi:hypothetical protein